MPAAFAAALRPDADVGLPPGALAVVVGGLAGVVGTVDGAELCHHSKTLKTFARVVERGSYTWNALGVVAAVLDTDIASRASSRPRPANATALVSSVVKMPINVSQDGRWLTCPHSGEVALVYGASATASAIRPAGLNMMPVGRR